METGEKVGAIKGINKFLAGVGILRFLLKKQGYEVDTGCVLVFDDANTLKRFKEGYGSWKDVKRLTSIRERGYNFQEIMYEYKKRDNPANVLEFLNSSQGFPILLVCGIVPDFLREDFNIFKMKSIDEKLAAKECRYDRLKQYVIEETKYVEKLIFHKNQRAGLGETYELMMAILRVWNGLEGLEQERDLASRFIFQKEESLIRKYIDEMEVYQEDYEVESAVRDLIFRYFKQNLVCSEEQEISVLCSQSKERVLHDEKFYYFPEKLLKKICEPLTTTISFLQLKHEMFTEGLLIVHDTQKRTFTVNKMFCDSESGKIVRMRFLKIPKDVLISKEGLLLEDIRPREEESNTDGFNEEIEGKGEKDNALCY